ncbi:hypothetical protein [Pseudoscardovia suis]|jgi:hypothetical protein|uniref:Uncharacterized protein n=1 Tax=Pseudoscardovia suis TaxID=987063 RepID=A0A261EPR6_9BIFI|nr:hypothetical protein [Pseudoscardovia suis]OZG48845.1 hypothetical protein PSSU_1669 [Pseudoscardovia suis]PJJ63989.1 hypothetical protein CLV65_1613 [Pseudoscardovia suis]
MVVDGIEFLGERVNGVPRGAHGKWIIVRRARGGWWYWGSFESYADAVAHLSEAGHAAEVLTPSSTSGRCDR